MHFEQTEILGVYTTWVLEFAVGRFWYSLLYDTVISVVYTSELGSRRNVGVYQHEEAQAARLRCRRKCCCSGSDAVATARLVLLQLHKHVISDT
jgi:hypothetical protein